MAISDSLKNDLLTSMDTECLFQKHVIDGSSHFFTDVIHTPDDEYLLRRDIAQSTNTNINDVIIIGSAKLGFSVKTPDFLPFDHLFTQTKNTHEKSDIDIALVSGKFYDEVSESIFHLSCHFDENWRKQNWINNQYYVGTKNLFLEYTKYIARGWLRPDFMPNAYLNEAAWTNSCKFWTNKLGRKVSIGIYSNWLYLKHYHMDNLIKLQAKFATLEMQ